MAGKQSSSTGNQSVARAMAVLNLLADRASPMGVREVARQLRIAPSIAQRLITTLAKAGFLERADATQLYTIGYRAFQVGNAFIGQTNLHSAVMPELYAMAEQQINGFLGVRRDTNLLYLATVQSNGPVAINHRPGALAHLHSTAMGKALLAEMPDDEVRALLAQKPLERVTVRTTVSMAQLLSELQAVRRQGYATSDEENRLGFFSTGVVVRDASNQAIAVISGAVPSSTLRRDERARFARHVMEAADRASRKLGARVLDRGIRVASPGRAVVRKPSSLYR